MCSQICRALVARNHPKSFEFVEQLFTLFEVEDISWEAGRVLGLIAASNEVLSKKNYAVLKARA